MKKLTMFIITLLILVPGIVYASDYNTVKFSAVFSTSADVSGIDKIYVQYSTFKNNEVKDNNVTLLKETNFSTTISVNTVEDINVLYAYCITMDGIVDKYGFLPISVTKSTDTDNNTVSFALNVTYNNLKFDGEKYRQNSDLTDEDIDMIKKSIQGELSGTTTTSSSNNTTTTTSTIESPITTSEGPIRIGTTESTIATSTVISDPDTEDDKKVETKEKKVNSTQILIYIVVGLLVFVFIFTIVTVIKINEANKRV